MRFLPLCAALVLLTGCETADRPGLDDEPFTPYIVSTDPPWRAFTAEEITALVERGPLPYTIPPRFVHVTSGAYDTVTVTFSSPTEDLEVYVNWQVGDGHRLDRNVFRAAGRFEA